MDGETLNRVTIENLVPMYPGAVSTPALEKEYINLEIPSGQIFGFVGPNGSGKTTILKVIAGLLPPSMGKVTIHHALSDNTGISHQPVKIIMDGFQLEEFPLSIYENMMSNVPHEITRQSAQANVDHMLHEFELWDWRDVGFGQLSQGLHRKAAIACALIAEPELLIFDEPNEYLDIPATRTVEAWLQSARRSGTTVILATRQPKTAQVLCDRVAIVREGHIILDRPVTELERSMEGEYYRILLRGEIDSRRAKWFGGLLMTAVSGITELSIVVEDQAALHGLLVKIRDLSIPLVSIECIEPRIDVLLTYLMNAPLNQLGHLL
jgi:ABC-2 type transport system ATP-binding protein